jgi:hypothetical protein
MSLRRSKKSWRGDKIALFLSRNRFSRHIPYRGGPRNLRSGELPVVRKIGLAINPFRCLGNRVGWCGWSGAGIGVGSACPEIVYFSRSIGRVNAILEKQTKSKDRSRSFATLRMTSSC